MKIKSSEFDKLMMQISGILVEQLSAEKLLSPLKVINSIKDKDKLVERLQFICMLNTFYLLQTSGVEIQSNLKDIDDNSELIEEVILDLERLRIALNKTKDNYLEITKS